MGEFKIRQLLLGCHFAPQKVPKGETIKFSINFRIKNLITIQMFYKNTFIIYYDADDIHVEFEQVKNI